MKLRSTVEGRILILISVALAALLFLVPEARAKSLLITGDGSTFAYPMYSKWFDEYRRVATDVQFTYQPIGSGAGIHDVMLGVVDFGGTDGPLNKTQMLDFSTHRNCEVLHFPMAFGADVPIYNLPGITEELNFTSEALAGVFLGQITKWNDPKIASANPGVFLPAHEITVVHRLDASGTTYVWTDYLSKVSLDWKERVGTSISVIWPTGVPAKGNQAVAHLVSQTPYSIGYAELTYAAHNKIAYGTVKNAAGDFVKADFASVTAAAAGAAQNMPNDFRMSITSGEGRPSDFELHVAFDSIRDSGLCQESGYGGFPALGFNEGTRLSGASVLCTTAQRRSSKGRTGAPGDQVRTRRQERSLRGVPARNRGSAGQLGYPREERSFAPRRRRVRAYRPSSSL